METRNTDHFPLMNHGQCKLFANMSCVALTLMVSIALFARSAHLKPFAFAILMTSLCPTIITLVVGVTCVFLAENAAHEYRNGRLYEPPFDSPNRDYARQDLLRNLEMAWTCEDRGLEILRFGLIFSLGVIVELAVLLLF